MEVVLCLSFFSKIQLVVYYQCCLLIGLATTGLYQELYVIAHQLRKTRAFWWQKRIKV